MQKEPTQAEEEEEHTNGRLKCPWPPQTCSIQKHVDTNT